MRCVKCKENLPEGSSFCSNCGCAIETAAETDTLFYKKLSEIKRQKVKNYVIAGAVCAVVLAVLVVAALYRGITPLERFEKLIKTGDYDGAKSQMADMSKEGVEKARDLAVAECEKAYKEFNAGKINYEEALAVVIALKDAMAEKQVEEVEEKLEALRKSKENLLEAEKLAEDNNYKRAVFFYQAVIEEDTLYDEAQSRAELVKAEIRKEFLMEAETHVSAGDYSKAIKRLEESKEYLNEDATIQARIEEIKTAYCKKYVEEATAYAEAGELEKAIDSLTDCIWSVGGTDEIVQLRDDYTSTYRASFFTEAAACANAGNYEEAVAWLNRGTAYFGDVEDFTAKIEEYKSMYPVHLYDLEPASGKNWISDTEVEDIYGNKFRKGLKIWSYGTDPVCEYVPNKVYKNFKTKILVSKNSDTSVKMHVRIYADDRQVFDSGELSYKSSPIDVNLDITGVTIIKIEVFMNGFAHDFDEGIVLLDDPVFTK